MQSFKHEVKYYECDRMGITHHSNYIRFMEEARVAWMDWAGYGFERMENDGVTSPVVSVECIYKSPTTFKDTIEIDVYVESLTTLKFTFGYTMRVGDRLVCTAKSTHCFMEKGRPIALAERYPVLHQAALSEMKQKQLAK